MGLKESGLRGSLRNVSVGIDAIPDSAVFHQPWTEGSGTTAEDVIGSNDGTITTTDQWVSNSSFEGGFGLEFGDVEEDSGEYVDLGSSIVDYTGQTYIAFTVSDIPQSDDPRTTLYQDTTDSTIRSFSTDEGQLRVQDMPNRRAWNNPDSGLQRVGVWSDWDNGETRIYANGIRVDDDDGGGTATAGDGITIGNLPRGDFPFSEEMDQPIGYENVPDADQIAQDDYEATIG